MTEAQRREAWERLLSLARAVVALNDRYPFPPDQHHRALEDDAQAVLELVARPARLVRQRKR